MTREPVPVAILAARIMRAYPSLSAYSAASLADELCRIERAQHRHAERCCSGEDGGYVQMRTAKAGESARAYCGGIGFICEHDPAAEERAAQRIERSVGRWRSRLANLSVAAPGSSAEIYAAAERAARARVDLQGDPRGPVLLVRFPGEAEAVAV